MRDETVVALKVLRQSKKVALDREGLEKLCEDMRDCALDELWNSIAPKPASKKVAAKPQDPLLSDVKKALSKLKGKAPAKSARLVEYMLPDRGDAPPKSFPSALKILRRYFDDDAIRSHAADFMNRVLSEAGTSVNLDR